MADKDFKVKTGIDLPAPLPLSEGGTGQSTANNALNALMPAQVGHSGKFITTDGSNMTWAVAPQQTATDGAVGYKVFAGNTAPTGQNIGDLWIDGTTGNGIQLVRWRKTIASASSTLSGLDDNNLTLSYTSGNEQVYINGSLITRGQDYTATNGTSVSLTQAVEVGDTVEIFGNPLFSVTDTYTQSQADSRYVIKSVFDVSGKNYILNGAFDIWQRGTSVVGGNNIYTADRWSTFTDSQTRTVSRQLTGDSTNLPNIQYCARMQRPAADTGTGRLIIGSGLETANSIPLIGKTVTLSFYARAGANFSASANQLLVYLQYGTGTDQNVFVGFTGHTNIVAEYKTLTNTWQRFSISGTFPTNATQIGYQFGYTPTGTAGSADYFEITGVQLEQGSVPTSFSRSEGSISGELAACQRYYLRNSYTGSNSGLIGPAYARTTGIAFATWTFPVTMRSTPTLAFSNGTQYFNLQIAGGDATFNTLSGSSLANTDRASLRADAGTHTVGQAGVLSFNNSSAWIEASAEI